MSRADFKRGRPKVRPPFTRWCRDPLPERWELDAKHCLPSIRDSFSPAVGAFDELRLA